jgi:NTE family protein
MGKKLLVLGGGAPNFTLMSGALLALHEEGIRFHIIRMAGAGAVAGLVYLAPKYLTPEQALENTVNFGVSDVIYSNLPINYKLFMKGGAEGEAFRDYWQSLPQVRAAMNQYWMNPLEKLESDWLLLQGAMIGPTDLNFFTSGICLHVPFIENVVDFDKLKDISTECFLSAYSIEQSRIVTFSQSQIDLDHFKAALSFPFIYPPYRIGNEHYYEGAAVNSLGLELENFVEQNDVDRVVVFDVLRDDLIHRPRNLVDAYSQSIIVPLVANANKELAIFEYWTQSGMKINPAHPESPVYDPPPLGMHTPYVLSFPIPPEHRPYTLDWSRSNLEMLFEIGYREGKRFAQDPSNWALYAM